MPIVHICSCDMCCGIHTVWLAVIASYLGPLCAVVYTGQPRDLVDSTHVNVRLKPNTIHYRKRWGWNAIKFFNQATAEKYLQCNPRQQAGGQYCGAIRERRPRRRHGPSASLCATVEIILNSGWNTSARGGTPPAKTFFRSAEQYRAFSLGPAFAESGHIESYLGAT